MKKFEDLNISQDILDAINAKGFETPSPIQAKILPILLDRDIDVIGQAQTGTGKTAAFGIPVLDKLNPKQKKVQALILTPTRELTVQVSDELNSLKGKKRAKIYPIYGGQSIDIQINRLKKGADIIVGTPGRVIDHLNRGTLKIDAIRYFILDEADEMLNMGFAEDIKKIFEQTPEQKQVLLFSATMPKEILKIAKTYMKDYEIVKVKSENLTTDLTSQIYYEVYEEDKFEALCRILDTESSFYGIVFCRTKRDVDNVANKLIDRGYNAEGLHGDISQHQRERILRKFKTKTVNVMVATDVAARGIDVSDLTHVINYSIPQDPESYVHRIGRTGRAGKEGTAITFITPHEYHRLLFIQRAAKTEINKVQIPTIKDMISRKKESIVEMVSNKIENLSGSEIVQSITQQLTSTYDSNILVEALLELAFENELDEKKYVEIKTPIKGKRAKKSQSNGNNRDGILRLFVAKGKKDGFGIRELLQYIETETGVKSKLIQNTRVFDDFSFISAPLEEAEYILQVFKKNKKGRRPIIEKAKEKR